MNLVVIFNDYAYEYDAENVRTAKVTGRVRTEYTTDRESTYSQVLVKKEYEKNVFGLYTEQKNATTYVYGTGLVSERRDRGEELYYHYNHLGSTVAVSDKGGNVVYRIVYDTYGELSDIQNANRISLKTAKEAQEYTLAELTDAAGIEYLYNGKYGVTTDSNGLYYMRARYYNQDIKRFINRDIVSGDITNSQSLNRYCYVQGNPVSLTDPFGLCPTAEEIRKIEFSRKAHAVLDGLGIIFDVADVLNAGYYAWEGDYGNAIWSVLFLLPCVGSLIGLPIKYAFKWGGNVGEALAKFAKKYVPELAENAGKFIRNMGEKLDDAGRWVSKKIDDAGEWIQRKSDDAWKWIQRKLGRSFGKEVPLTVDEFIRANVHPDFQQNVKDAFTKDAKVTILEKDITVYRYRGGVSSEISYWYTPYKTANPAADLALPAGNTYQYMDTVTIPKGTMILEGTVAPNFGQSGGGYQFYVPNPSVVIK